MLVEKLLKVALLGSSWVMYLLLALSVFSIGAMIERALYSRKRSDDVDELGEKFIQVLEQGDAEGALAVLKKSPSVEASVLAPALRHLCAGPDAPRPVRGPRRGRGCDRERDDPGAHGPRARVDPARHAGKQCAVHRAV